MILRGLTIIALVIATLLGYVAYQIYTRGNDLARSLTQMESEIRAIEQEEALLRNLPDKPVLPSGEALSDFIVAMRAEVDLLGGAARISLPRGSTITWTPVKFGVVSTKFAIELSALEQGAPAILSMVTERIASRSVRLLKSKIERMSEVVIMKIDIELFGRKDA